MLVIFLMTPAVTSGDLVYAVDKVTRYVHVSYVVPTSAPDVVISKCSWSEMGKNDWKPAKITPLVSETAIRLAEEEQHKRWSSKGEVAERRAAGLKRTVVFNPYPQAQKDGIVDVDFRVEISDENGNALTTRSGHLKCDNSDVMYITDFTKVIQGNAISTEPADGKWFITEVKSDLANVTSGHALECQASDIMNPQLTYPLNLKGDYAIFLTTKPDGGGVRLRLTEDEVAERLWCRYAPEETLWRWDKLDNQHLVIKQPHGQSGYNAATLEYLRMVPLTPEMVKELDGVYNVKPTGILAGYFEPYSWAFNEDIQETLQHREPLSLFAKAGINIVDFQLARFGMKAVYESRVADQLFWNTSGDPSGPGEFPKTYNVGRMQQFTNTVSAETRYARELGMIPHANFGASSCYEGSPIESEFSKAHPEYLVEHCLRFEAPEVRKYMLDSYREVLELGATGVSIDYCRYPDGIEKSTTVTDFHRELRKLADVYSQKRGQHITIMVRFPAKGVRKCEMFDFKTWAKEGLVDYMCPSNLQGRTLNFDIKPYLKAVKNTKTKLLPVVDALDFGLEMPGPFLYRVKDLYQSGVPGIYVYQADGRILSTPDERRLFKFMTGKQAIRKFWELDTMQRPACSKDIYINPPCQPWSGRHGWERLRAWPEGVALGEMEFYLDGKLVNKCAKPPYLLGTEESASDGVIPTGEHNLRIRAKDGDGWLERTFEIEGPH